MSKQTASDLAIQSLQRRFYQVWTATELVSHPSRWIYFLESQPGWVKKTALSVVSQVFDPKLLLRGIWVHEWSRERVGLTLAPSTKMAYFYRKVSLSDLFSAAELSVRLYWNRYLSPESQKLEVLGVEWEPLQAIPKRAKVQYGHVDIERDQLVFELTSSGEKQLETSVLVVDEDGLQVGAFRMTLRFEGYKALPSPIK